MLKKKHIDYKIIQSFHTESIVNNISLRKNMKSAAVLVKLLVLLGHIQMGFLRVYVQQTQHKYKRWVLVREEKFKQKN